MTKKYSSDKKMQNLFEGFNRFLNESEEESIEDILNTSTFQSELSPGLKRVLYPHLTSGMMSGPVSKATAMDLMRTMHQRGYYYDERDEKVALTRMDLYALDDVYKKLGGSSDLRDTYVVSPGEVGAAGLSDYQRQKPVELEKLQKTAQYHRDEMNRARQPETRNKELERDHREFLQQTMQQIKKLGGNSSFLKEEKEKQ